MTVSSMATARGPRRLLLALALVVPVAVMGVHAAADGARSPRAADVRAAVVNEDEIVTLTTPEGEKQPVAVGRLLTAELTGDDDADNFDWVITHRQDAMAGLRAGDYGAVLVIPRDVSAAAVSPAGDDPEAVTTARLRLITDDATDRLAGQLAGNVTEAAVAALNAQVAQTFIDSIFVSTTTIRDALAEAADGAERLHDGTVTLAGGAAELADGTSRLDDGAAELSAGSARLADGAGQVARGAGELSGGVARLDDGLQELRRQTATLPDDAAQLDQGARELRDGAQQLDSGARELIATVEPFLQMAQQLTDTVRAWAAQCADVLPPGACVWVAEAAAEAERVNAEVQTLGAQGALLTDGTGRLAAGLAQLSEATAQLASQAPALTGGVAQLADGSAQARAGAVAVADGTSQLASGAQELRSGSRQLRDGTAQAADGAGRLADGGADLVDGSGELADGLNDGVEQIPLYSPAERERISEVAAAPLRTSAERHHAVPVDALAIPAAVTLALLTAAAAAWAVRPALSRSRLVASQGLLHQLFAPLVKTLGIVAAQVAVLLAGAALFTDVDSIARPVEFALLAVLSVVSLTVLGQGVIAVFGRPAAAAVAVVAALVTLGAAATGTHSPLIGLLHSVSPLSPVLHGLEAAQAGVSTATPLVALALWAALGAGLTMLAAQRARSDLRWLLAAR
ncbi:hypothetical protein [Aeromicrobium phragmitis]|nr:hypothetical protein [Aeromicrobium phragmitis]